MSRQREQVLNRKAMKSPTISEDEPTQRNTRRERNIIEPTQLSRNERTRHDLIGYQPTINYNYKSTAAPDRQQHQQSRTNLSNDNQEPNQSIWQQSSHPVALFFLFLFRSLAIATYPSQAANVIDSKMFWMALYTFPVAWIFLLFIGIIKFNLSFLPIVLLALVFNLTNTIGFTYADRDSKRKWANELGSSGINGLLGQFGGGVLGGLTKVGMGKIFG
ncbi:hypothetical protein KEM48_005083 [Puccinia striiformis f. sp. tritici PST-130]|nr:hypothetical protein KEM48_005083 [Puccinia striiformis f. sp. tritici PST-130]